MSRSSRPSRSRARSSAWVSAIVIGVRRWCEASWRNRRWASSRRLFFSPMSRRSRSAPIRRLASQTIATNIAASSGISAASSTDWLLCSRSRPIPPNVVMITMPSPHSTGSAGHSRSAYSTANPVEMRWKGTVSQDGQTAIATRFSRTRATQATSSPVRPRVSSRVSQARSARWTSADRKPVPLAADGPDRVIADLRPQPADAHADDVGARVEVVAPHRLQQLAL